MQYAIKLNKQGLSYIFNNMSSSNEFKQHTWYQLADALCWDEEKQVFKEVPILLNKEQRDIFYQDIIVESEEILRQLSCDVRYHTINDTSWFNSKDCLEVLSDILECIRNAEKF